MRNGLPVGYWAYRYGWSAVQIVIVLLIVAGLIVAVTHELTGS